MSDNLDLNLDLEPIREKYAKERDKRIRKDKAGQYHKVQGDFAYFEEDPYVDEKVQREPLTDLIDVVIIGGGFGGLLAGAYLRKAGIDDIRIIEKGGDFGGTWYWNRYPGAQCDIESYCYLPLLEETGFMPTLKYSFGDEIHAHTKRIAKHFDLYSDVCFQTEVTEVRWDEGEQVWVIHTDKNDAIRAKHVCMANGPLSRPQLPGVPGIETYKRHSFHTSRWDYEYTGGDLHGGLDKIGDKRVAIIGTGATALQCVPHVAAGAKHTYVIQRTPSSVDERGNSETDPDWAASLKPGWQQERINNFNRLVSGVPMHEDKVSDGWTDMVRNIAALAGGAMASGELGKRPIEELVEIADFQSMERIRNRVDEVVEDKETAAKLKAHYRKFCKRPSFHDEYLRAFNRPNVTLLDTDGQGVTRITETGIVIGDTEYEIDCLIFATGFEVGTSYTSRSGYEVVGRNGTPLSKKWENGPQTLFGIQTAGFPNAFFMGPVHGATSINLTQTLTEQAKHISHVLSRKKEVGANIQDVSETAEAEWSERVKNSGIEECQLFLGTCTPGYYNGEGDKDAKGGFWEHEYRGGGPAEFFEIIGDWRSVSYLPGLLLDGEALKPSDEDEQYLRTGESIRARLHHEPKAFLNQGEFMGAPKIGTVPVEVMRQVMAMGAMARRGPKISSVTDITIPAGTHDISARIYKDCETPKNILLYFHGGGWCVGSLPEYDAPLQRIVAGTDTMAISVDYRMAPEHPFPAAIEDAVTALKWIGTQRAEFGAADAPIFVGGDSAGGNISAAISILSRDELKVPIAGQILLYPSVDLDIDHERMDAFVPPLLTKAECDWFVSQYVPNKADRSDPRFAPFRATSHADLPPALITTAEFDLLRAEGEAYRDVLEAADVPVTYEQADGAIHGYFSLMDGQTHAMQAQKAIRDFIAARGN